MNIKENSINYDEYHFYSIWSWLHLIVGVISFIVVYKYSNLSSLNVAIILLILHTIYELKDGYVMYNIYNNDIDLIRSGYKYISDINNRTLNKKSLHPQIVLPPNSFKNSIGDTVFFALGLYISYLNKHLFSSFVVKILLIVSIISWIDIIISHIYVLELGLYNKKYVRDYIKNYPEHMSQTS